MASDYDNLDHAIPARYDSTSTTVVIARGYQSGKK
jgi:hypothetical protein